MHFTSKIWSRDTPKYHSLEDIIEIAYPKEAGIKNRDGRILIQTLQVGYVGIVCDLAFGSTLYILP